MDDKPVSSPKEIRNLYKRAALNSFAERNLTSRQWAEYRQVAARHEVARDDETKKYHAEYDTRVEHEKKKLVDEGGSVKRKHDWFGRDTFNSEDISRQAHRNVQHAHSNKLESMQQEESADKSELIDRAGLANQFKDRGRDAFNRTAERGQLRAQFQTRSQ